MGGRRDVSTAVVQFRCNPSVAKVLQPVGHQSTEASPFPFGGRIGTNLSPFGIFRHRCNSNIQTGADRIELGSLDDELGTQRLVSISDRRRRRVAG
jgi:hypothetical protein